jgi:hypothetical protein
MRVFRSVVLAGAVVATALGGASSGAGALQAKTNVTIGGIATPPILAFTTTPQTLGLTVDVRFSTDVPDADPETVKQATVFFSHGPRVNGALFPSCDAKKLKQRRGDPRACPKGSRIGTGVAIGTSPQFHGVDEKLHVELYNGSHGHSIIFFLHGEHPVAISGLIDASFQAIHSHRWAYKLTLKVPQGLQQISRGIYASLLRFTTKVGASVLVHEGGRTVRRGYIEVLACPPGALVPVSSKFDFLNGSSASANGYISCGKR